MHWNDLTYFFNKSVTGCRLFGESVDFLFRAAPVVNHTIYTIAERRDKKHDSVTDAQC